jgi:hypothetical protein
MRTAIRRRLMQSVDCRRNPARQSNFPVRPRYHASSYGRPQLLQRQGLI